MRRALRILLLGAVLTAAACGSSGGDATVQAELDEMTADRDALAQRVAELEEQLGSADGKPEPTAAVDETLPTTTAPEEPLPTVTPEPTAAPATPAPTAPVTPPPPTEPAAAVPAPVDASPYVASFGDLSAVSLPPGDAGQVSIVASAGTVDRRGAVNLIVRNNTNAPVGRINVNGTARDGAGALVGSGSSQGFQPQVVAPGEVAFGYVYFDIDIPEGAELDFEFDVDPEPVDTYFVPVTITEINNTGSQIIGLVTNDSDVDVSGPISADAICFGPDGTMIGYVGSYAEQDELAPGGTGSFAIDLYGEDCANGIAAASGYGDL